MQFQPTVGRAFVCVCGCECVCVSLRVCMHVSMLHFVSIVQVGNKRFREKKNGLRTEGWTDGRMHYGSEQSEIGTSKFALSHELRYE